MGTGKGGKSLISQRGAIAGQSDRALECPFSLSVTHEEARLGAGEGQDSGQGVKTRHSARSLTPILCCGSPLRSFSSHLGAANHARSPGRLAATVLSERLGSCSTAQLA